MQRVSKLVRVFLLTIATSSFPFNALATPYTISMTAVPASGGNIGTSQLITYTITLSNGATADTSTGFGFIRVFANSPAQTMFQFDSAFPTGVVTQPASGSTWGPCVITPNGNGTNRFACYSGDGIGGGSDTFASNRSVVFRVNALVAFNATVGSVKTNTTYFETDLDGNGITEVFTSSQNVTHTVVATPYSVTYDGNGNTGGTIPTDGSTYTTGAPVTVRGNTGNLVRTGYTFAGWNTFASGDGINYPATGAITFAMGTTNTTLYAKWTTPCSLDVDGNNSIDPLTDGLMMLRAMFGLTGTAVTNGAVGGGSPSRATWAQIQPFLNGNCGTAFAP